jgi:hypothetical protein
MQQSGAQVQLVVVLTVEGQQHGKAGALNDDADNAHTEHEATKHSRRNCAFEAIACLSNHSDRAKNNCGAAGEEEKSCASPFENNRSNGKRTCSKWRR